MTVQVGKGQPKGLRNQKVKVTKGKARPKNKSHILLDIRRAPYVW